MHDEYIAQAGGSFSKFHLMSYIGLMICNSTNGYLVYNLVFLLLFPKYHCIDEFGVATPCKRLATCESYDFVEEAVLSNWVQKFDLRCRSNFTIGLFGSMFFLGKVVGMVTLSHLGDTLGRIKLLRFSQCVTFACYFSITFLITNSKFLTIPIFIAGLLSCWRTNLSYIYGQELFQEKYKNVAGSLMLVNDVATLLWSTLFYQTVSAEWTHFFSIVLCMMALSIYILYQMPESPSFLFDICEFDASEAAYNYIAKFNGKKNHITVEPPMEESFGNVSIVTMEDKPDFNEMLQNPSFRLKLFLVIIFWIGVEFCFFTIGFHMKYLPGNIFQIVTLQGFVTAIAFSSGGIISKKLGIQNTIATCFTMATFGSYLMIKAPSSFELPLLIFTKMGVDCAYSQVMVYTTSEFPGYMTSKILGICNVFSSLAGMMAPQIAEMDDPLPMWVCFTICFISMVGSVKNSQQGKQEDADNRFNILKKVLDESATYEDKFARLK